MIGSFTCVSRISWRRKSLSGIKITCEEDLKTAGQWFIDKGVEKVFITLNKDGVYYKDKDEEGFIRPGQVKVVSATGAGDSFSAAILMGMVLEMSARDIARYGMAAAQITMESSHAVNENMSKEEIEKENQKMYKDHLDVNPEVVKALEEGRPVVAPRIYYNSSRHALS